MDFDWKQYYYLAQNLHGDTSVTSNSEAKKRSAVSRLYFAAYCLSRNYARKFLKFTITRDVGDHSELRTHLQINGFTGIARMLSDLRRFRNDCDYEDVVPNLEGLVRMSLERTQKILDQLP